MAINYALASNGGTLTGTNAYGSGPGTDYDITWANQDSTAPRYDGFAGHNWSPDTPDNLVVELSETIIVSSVVLWFSDYDTRATDPGPSDVAGGWAAADFTISTWNGSSWDVQSTITGNDKLTRTIAIPGVGTTKVKFEWTADQGNAYIGLQEIEVWGELPATVAAGTSSAQAVGYQATRSLWADGAAQGSSTCSGAGTGIFPNPKVVWNSADKDVGMTLSNGGTTASAISSTWGLSVRSTQPRDRGKRYFEIELSVSTGGRVGLARDLSKSTLHYNSLYYGPSASGGYMGYNNDFDRQYTNQGSQIPRVFRFAIDFEAGRFWIGDERGWRGDSSPMDGDPTVAGNATFDESVGLVALAPTFQSNPTAGTNKAVLRAALYDFRYEVPAGFLPWDDYLDIGVAKGSASGSGVATGISELGVAAAQGTSLAQGMGALLMPTVGTATGSGVGAASTEWTTGAAAGTSTVDGAGKPTARSVADAAGASTASATCLLAGVGVGSAAGVAVPYVHSPIRELNAALSATSVLPNPVSDGWLDLNDGVTQTYGYRADVNTASIKAVWSANKIINGIELYSSAWNNPAFIGSTPDGTETFPAGVGGAVNIQIQYDSTGIDVYYVDALPIIYGNNLIRRTVIFPDWVETKRIKVTVTTDSSYLRVQELKVFTPSILHIQEIEDVVVETSTLLAVNTITLESSGAATDALLGTGYAILEDGGQASSTEASTWTYQGVGQAQGTSTAASQTILEEQLVDGGAAVETLALSRSLKIQSTGVLGTLLSGNVTHSEVSSGNATGTISGENVVTQSEESTGTATDTVIGIRRVTVIEISGGDTQASNTSAGLATLVLTSSGQAVSLAVQHSMQTVTIVSAGNAYETLPTIPFQGSQGSLPIFWTNSISAGAATWEGLPFNSFIEVDGVVYAAGSFGIFEMGDDIDDLTSAVSSEVEWDLVDNGSVEMKRMRSVYVNARTASPFTVRVANEQGVFEYPTETADSDTVTNHRAAVGRGIVSRNVRLSLLHTKHFVAESAGVGILESKRRI